MTQQSTTIGFAPHLFRDKVIAITGGAHGIGQATVLQAAELGARVVVLDIDPKGLSAMQSRLDEMGVDALCIAGDIRDLAYVASALSQIDARWGRLDGWVNNAYSDRSTPLAEMTPEIFQISWSANVCAPFEAVRQAVPLFRKTGGGAIVNVSSVLAHRSHRGRGSYVTSKAALEGMTRSLAMDLSPVNIRVNGVIPGAIQTRAVTDGRLRKLGPNATEDQIRATHEHETLVYTSHQPLNLAGQPLHVANAILFLLSDLAAFITGVFVPVDGGYLIDGRTWMDRSFTELHQSQAALLKRIHPDKE